MKFAEKLNPYLANLVVLYAKFHDLHWNVKGKMFVAVHEYTESRYDDLAEKFDEVAEKIIMKGERPVSKVAGYMELATVKEMADKDFACEEVIAEVLADTKLLKEQAVALRNEFDAADEFTVVAMLEDHIAGYEKQIWFLESMLK